MNRVVGLGIGQVLMQRRRGWFVERQRSRTLFSRYTRVVRQLPISSVHLLHLYVIACFLFFPSSFAVQNFRFTKLKKTIFFFLLPDLLFLSFKVLSVLYPSSPLSISIALLSQIPDDAHCTITFTKTIP